MKNRKASLSRNQITPGTNVKGTILNGGSQPPRNSTLIKPHSMMTFIYSPKKNKRNGAEEYSTKNPATSSDSASKRSKGGRWVSANEETKKITSMGKRMEKKFQCAKANTPVVCCASTMRERLSEPANKRTVMITKPIETS